MSFAEPHPGQCTRSASNVKSVTSTLQKFLPTLLIFKALVCTAHRFPGMGDFLFGYGEEKWRDDVAEGRKKRY